MNCFKMTNQFPRPMRNITQFTIKCWDQTGQDQFKWTKCSVLCLINLTMVGLDSLNWTTLPHISDNKSPLARKNASLTWFHYFPLPITLLMSPIERREQGIVKPGHGNFSPQQGFDSDDELNNGGIGLIKLDNCSIYQRIARKNTSLPQFHYPLFLSLSSGGMSREIGRRRQ